MMDVVRLFLHVSLLCFHLHNFLKLFSLLGFALPIFLSLARTWFCWVRIRPPTLSKCPGISGLFHQEAQKLAGPMLWRAYNPRRKGSEMRNFPATPNELSKQQQAQGHTKGSIQVRSKTPLGSKKFRYGHINSIHSLSMLYRIIEKCIIIT